MIWKILEIEKTRDEEEIKRAYREKLRFVNPEDDQEGFKELRGAYEEAMKYAALGDVEEDEQIETFTGNKNEVDLWIDKVDAVYKDVKTRIDESKWEALFKDDVCEGLDTEMEAAEKLLVYFMSHSNMPQNIWQLVDKRFGYIENMEHLKEKFPENYLEYVKWQIENQGFIDYTLFDGKTDEDVDEYINKIYEVKAVAADGDLPKLKQMIKELKRYEIAHPYTDTEEARYFVLEANSLKDNEENDEKRQKYLQDALAIMEDLDFEYSDNPYIERVYAEVLIENEQHSKAKMIYESLLEKDETNYSAKLGIARCVFLEGNPEDAKEQIEDVLEERVQDADSLLLLEEVNAVLAEKYQKQLEEELVPDICYKLGWCYYQQKKFEEGLQLLDQLENVEETYDYVNLRCRLFLANNQYEEALPLAEKWLELIEATVEDGTKEMKRRKNRSSLAHFSIGVCNWETLYKKADEEDKEKVVSQVVYYIKTAIKEDENRLVRLSYMEQLARFYLEAEHYEECIEVCDELVEMDRGFFPAYVHRQKANSELRNAKEVVDDYFACIEIYPAYVPPYILAAEVFFAFDQYDDVENVIENAKEAQLESDSLELYAIRCIHYKEFSKQNVEKALERMEQLRKKVYANEEETDIEELFELEREYAILQWDLEQVDATLSITDEFLKKHPNNPSMLHLKADVLLREKRLEEALEICVLLTKLEPKNLHTHTKLGNCYERMDKLSEAIECYKAVLKVNPEFAPALRRMMYLYSYMSNQNDNLEQCQKAVDYATRFIQVTGSAEGYVERGNLYIDLYELHKAVADCKKAIELDSEAYYAYNNLGCALLKLRQVNKAIEPLKQAIVMAPNKDHLPYLNLAECYVLQESYGKAIETYQSALKLLPDNVRLQKEIAKLYVKMKKYDKAVEVYQKLVDDIFSEVKQLSLKDRILFKYEMEPTDLEKNLMLLYCDIADVYRQAEKIEMAESYYNKVYSVYRKLFKHFNADVTEKVAEYYRDKGELKRALWVMNHTAEGNMAVAEVDTWDDYHLAFLYATIYFELGNKKRAKHYADFFIEKLLQRYGGEEKMLSDRRYRPMFLYDLAIMHVCGGNLDKARFYIEQIPDCKLCVTCETCDCFEYYFCMGLIAELEGRNGEAIRLYEKAIQIRGDYPCAKRHLLNLQTKKNS